MPSEYRANGCRDQQLRLLRDERRGRTVLYGANKWSGRLSNGTEVALTQNTDYPWSGEIKIYVEPNTPVEFSLMLRVPSWARGASVLVRSRAEKEFEKFDLTPGEYFPLQRKWSSGDLVELALPMRVRLVEGHELIEETRGQVAVLRGPVVYCIESPDAGQGIHLSALAIPRSVQFRPVQQLIGSVQITALEGEVLKYEHKDWGTDLYRDVSDVEPQRLNVRMIPYFCWDNRGINEMSIWLPIA